MTAPTALIDRLIRFVRERDDDFFCYARERAIDPLTLRTQMLLHLPRVISADHFPGQWEIAKEIRVVSDFIEERQARYAHWLTAPDHSIALSDLVFGPIDADLARIFHERFHYVGSYRPGRHFALTDKHSGRIVCIGSTANFDLRHAAEKIAPHVDLGSVAVLSRFFAFRWAPKNIFSYFHRKLRHQLVKECDTTLMFSFINPNLGFNACSHKGAHWGLFAREGGTRYMYMDRRYRTMRFFVENYGTSDADELRRKIGPAFETASVALHPMLLLAVAIQRRARKAIPAEPYMFERPRLHNCERRQAELSPEQLSAS